MQHYEGVGTSISPVLWFYAASAVLAVYVWWDSVQRKRDSAAAVGYAVGTFVLAPFVLPFHFAKRPLKPGEVREGGTAWNVLRTFAIGWTILWGAALLWGTANAGRTLPPGATKAEQTGAGIGMMLGWVLIAAIWFPPMCGALVVGLILKKSSVVERGPTGPILQVTPETKRSRAPKAFAISAITTGVLFLVMIVAAQTDSNTLGPVVMAGFGLAFWVTVGTGIWYWRERSKQPTARPMQLSITEARHFCTECGKTVSAASKFCGNCGQSTG